MSKTYEWPRFPNAPITEALLDIRAVLPSSTDLDRLSSFQEAIRDRYPQRVERNRKTLELQVKESGIEPVSKSSGPDGYLFKTADGRQTVQARLDGFTFNRLKPYDRWSTFRDEAHEHWKHYIEIAAPITVTRIALRYINVIEVPLPIADFKEYMLTIPEVAPSLPQSLKTFFMRLEIPDPARQAIVIITETIQPPPEGKEVLPFVFDIDVVRQGSFSPTGPGLWQALEELRDLKNESFFNSLTYKARELFK